MMANKGGLAAYSGGACNPPAVQLNPPICTATQTAMAANDLALWTQALKTQLPSGTGTVTAVAGGVYTISIQWIEHESSPNNSVSINVPKKLDVSFQP
jgi:hypothetical protein